MSNFTHVGSAGSALSPSLSTYSVGHYQGTQLGNVGLFLALRHITLKCASKIQRVFKTKPSEEAVTIRRQGYIYRDNLAAVISRLEIEIANLRKNPKAAMEKIEELIAENQKLLGVQERNDFQCYQDELLYERFVRSFNLCANLKPHICEKLKNLLPTLFSRIEELEKKKKAKDSAKTDQKPPQAPAQKVLEAPKLKEKKLQDVANAEAKKAPVTPKEKEELKRTLKDSESSKAEKEWVLELPNVKQKHAQAEPKVQEKKAPADLGERDTKAPKELEAAQVRDERVPPDLKVGQTHREGKITEPTPLENQRVKVAKQQEKIEIDAQRKRDAAQAGGCVSYNLSNLSETDGVILTLPTTGIPVVNSAGPIDGGSIPAYAVGFSGRVIFVYGGPNVTSADLSNPTSTQGLEVEGGEIIEPLRDFNFDGIPGDVAITTYNQVCLLWAPLLNPTNLSALGSKGVVIVGPPNSNFGQCLAYGVDSAGNPILFIGAPSASITGSNDQSGQLFAIYAHAMPWAGIVNASTLSMPAGFVINGTFPGANFGCPLAAGSIFINGTQVPVFAAAAPAFGASANGVVYVGYLQNSTIPRFNFDGTDGFSAAAPSSSDTINIIEVGGALGPGGTPAIVIGINGASGNGFYFLYDPVSAQFSLSALSSPAGLQLSGPIADPLSLAIIDMEMSGNPGIAGGTIVNDQIIFIAGQPNGLSPGLNASNLLPSQGFFVKGPGTVNFGIKMANFGAIRGDGRQALGIISPGQGLSINATLVILFAKNPSPCPVTPSSYSPTVASTPQPSPTGATASATPIGSPLPSVQSPSAFVQPPPSAAGPQPIIIAFGVLIPLLVAGVVVAVIVLKRRKQACFADTSRAAKGPDLALQDL